MKAIRINTYEDKKIYIENFLKSKSTLFTGEELFSEIQACGVNITPLTLFNLMSILKKEGVIKLHPNGSGFIYNKSTNEVVNADNNQPTI